MIGSSADHDPHDFAFRRQQSRETEKMKLVRYSRLPWADREESWGGTVAAGVAFLFILFVLVML